MVTQKKQKKYLLPKGDASALTRQETQSQARRWFGQLRDQLCHEWQQLEQQGVAAGHGGMTQAGRFEKTQWQRQGTGESQEQGGGEAALMRGGVFEKVGVNISEVYGDLSSVHCEGKWREHRKIQNFGRREYRWWHICVRLICRRFI